MKHAFFTVLLLIATMHISFAQEEAGAVTPPEDATEERAPFTTTEDAAESATSAD